MKTLLAENSALLITLVIGEVNNLHQRVIKTLRYISDPARVWVKFIQKFANRCIFPCLLYQLLQCKVLVHSGSSSSKPCLLLLQTFLNVQFEQVVMIRIL